MSIIKIENVSKKFCLSLKRSLIYGVKDIGRELIGLSKSDQLRKNEFWAVNQISFEVQKGEAIGLIGPNGSGKSTLLKMLNGLIKPDTGKITIRGRVGALIELGAGFNPILTGRENVYINGAILGFSKKEIDEKYESILAFSEIGAFINTPVQNYSSGMKIRLGFAVATNLEPDILLIDEVLAVGDLRFRLKCYEHLEKLKHRGTSMVIVSHDVNQLNRLCKRTIVFNKGKLDFDGPITKSIIRYDKLMQLKTLNKSHSVFNNHGISIKETVSNSNGEKTNSFNTGENMIVDLDFTSEKTFTEPLCLEAWIDSPNMGILGSFSKFDFMLEKGVNKVNLKLPKLPLLTGSYFLNFQIRGDKRHKLYLRKENFINFEMTGVKTNSENMNFTFLFNHVWN